MIHQLRRRLLLRCCASYGSAQHRNDAAGCATRTATPAQRLLLRNDLRARSRNGPRNRRATGRCMGLQHAV